MCLLDRILHSMESCMLLDPHDPHSAIIGHSPTSRSDKWALIITLAILAIFGGGLVAIIAYHVYVWATAWVNAL